MFKRPIAINQEIFIKPGLNLMVKTSNVGTIEYANENFIELSGYDISELIGRDINILKHPEMPNTIFDHVWENLLQKKNTKAIIKFLAKSGEYFWLQVKFDFKVDEVTRGIKNIYAYYTPVNKTQITDLINLYQKLTRIEHHSGIHTTENYFLGILEEKSMNYTEFIATYFQN